MVSARRGKIASNFGGTRVNEAVGKSSSGQSALTGGLWTMGERITAQIAQLLVFIFAARILGPAEFGVFALVSACAAIALRVSEMGWTPFIMSWSGDDKVPAQVLFTAVVSGFVIGVSGGVLALFLPFAGIPPRIALLAGLFAFWVFLATVSSAQKGVLIRENRLRASAFAEAAGEVVALGVALAALFEGFGVLSLVFGRIAFQTTQLVISFSATRIAPRPGLPADIRRDLFRFSGSVFLNRIVISLRLYAATFLIGGFLGAASVGYFRAAERLVSALGEVFDVPTQVLAWSLFRQTRDEHGGTTAGFQARANQFFLVLYGVAMPAFIWIALAGGDLIEGLIGPEWLPALPVVAVLALARAIMLPGVTTEALLSLAGQIHRLLPFTLIFFVVTLLVTTAGANIGLMGVAWAQVVVAGAVALATWWMFRRYAGIELLTCMLAARGLIAPIMVGTAALFLLRDHMVFSGFSPLLRLLFVTLATGIVYLLALAALNREARAFVTARLGSNRGRAE